MRETKTDVKKTRETNGVDSIISLPALSNLFGTSLARKLFCCCCFLVSPRCLNVFFLFVEEASDHVTENRHLPIHHHKGLQYFGMF